MELTGWSEEKEHTSVEALCKAKDDAMHCKQIHTLSFSLTSRVLSMRAGYIGV